MNAYSVALARQRAAPGEAQLRRDGTGEQHGEHVADQQRELRARAEGGHPERQHVRHREQHGDAGRPRASAGRCAGGRVTGSVNMKPARKTSGVLVSATVSAGSGSAPCTTDGRRLEQRAAGHEHQGRQHGADAQGDDEPA